MGKYDFLRAILCGVDHFIRSMRRAWGAARFVVLSSLWGIERRGRGWFIGKVVIRNTRKGRIRLGRGVTVQADFRINPIGPASPALLDVRPGGEIEIGDGSGLSSPIVSSAVFVKVGKNCKIGGGTRIMDHNFHAIDAGERRVCKGDRNPRAIVIGDDVFVGTGVTILKGTHIGDRSVVAAGSVVFGLDIPPDSMVKGNPAVICGQKPH